MNKQRRRFLRWQLFGEQDGRCWYCGELMSLSFARRDNIWPRSATLEHLHRRVDGGGNNRANLVLACLECNVRRGERDPGTYREMRSDRRMA